MKKKLVSVLMVAAMAASLVACGSNEAASTTTDASASTPAATTDAAPAEFKLESITAVVNGTFNIDDGEAGWAEFIEQWQAGVKADKDMDVKLTIQKLDHSGYEDAVGRLFASGDYPDVMIMSAEMFKQYAPTGLLWNMADAYANAEFQNRMNLPAINEGLMDASGALYGFAPTYGNGCVTYVKTAWLENCGINLDDIKTFDDYYAMLKKFHEEDPDGNGETGDTYGVVAAGFIGPEAPYVNYLPEFYQNAYPAILQDANGTWYDGFNTDANKAALTRLAQAYQDKVIDPETLTASTKISREKFFSNEQKGSSGCYTYWAGNWYNTLTTNLIKNEVNTELEQLAPIKEIKEGLGGYLNREAPVWVIIDDGDGNDAREQAIFDAFMDTMLDGDKVQTLWVYGAEGVHWSTEAESFKTNEGTSKEKPYDYEAGQFHLKQSPTDPNTIYSKNALDPNLIICPLVNGYKDENELITKGNKFFTSNCVDAPASPSSETLTNESGTINDAKNQVVTKVVTEGMDVDAAMNDLYVNAVGSTVELILSELNQ